MSMMPASPSAMAAVVLLASLDPESSRRLPARITAIYGELAEQLESARLHGRVELNEFIRRSEYLVGLRNLLMLRLASLVPGSEVPHPPIEDEISSRVLSVRRWRSGEPLKQERARIISRARADLVEVEGNLADLQENHKTGINYVVDQKGAQAGFGHRDDEFLRRASSLIERRRVLLARLAVLDPLSDAGRSARVDGAVLTAGGPDYVAAAIAPFIQTGNVEKLAADKKRAVQLRDQVGQVDSETERASQLATIADTFEATLDGTATMAQREQGAAAAALLANAMKGTFAGLLALEESLAPTSLGELASSISLARGAPEDFPAVIAELIAKGKAQRDAQSQ
jgi:hypothetical protein